MDYSPPSYNSPSFNTSLFLTDGGGYLTLLEGDGRYLRLSGGNVRGMTYFNSGLTINSGGLIVSAGGLNVNGTFTLNGSSVNLDAISGITPGNAVASKALILSSSKDISTLNSITSLNYYGTASSIQTMSTQTLKLDYQNFNLGGALEKASIIYNSQTSLENPAIFTSGIMDAKLGFLEYLTSDMTLFCNPSFTQYLYDGINPDTEISDGYSDLFDTGHKCRWILNGTSITSDVRYNQNAPVVLSLGGATMKWCSFKSHPCMFIGSPAFSQTIGFRTYGGLGADGSGTTDFTGGGTTYTVTASGRVYSYIYRKSQLYNASDPSYCPVSFAICRGGAATWSSMSFVDNGSGTKDPVDWTTTLTNASNCLFVNLLLSKLAAAQVTDAEVVTVIQNFITVVDRFGDTSTAFYDLLNTDAFVDNMMAKPALCTRPYMTQAVKPSTYFMSDFVNGNSFKIAYQNAVFFTAGSKNYGQRVMDNNNYSLMSFNNGSAINDVLSYDSNAGSFNLTGNLNISSGTIISGALSTYGANFFSSTTTMNSSVYINGFLGISNTSPGYPLDVSNHSTVVVSSNHAAIYSTGGSYNLPGPTNYLVSIRCSQAVRCGAVVISSDRRIKKDIKYLEDDKLGNVFLEKVKPAIYTLKESGSSELGYIAQDIAKAGFHGLISMDEEYEGLKVEEEGDLKDRLFSVRYEKIVCLLHNTILDLKKRITSLETKLN